MSPLVSVSELQRRNVLPVPDTARRSAPAPMQTDPIPGTEGIEAREPHAVATPCGEGLSGHRSDEEITEEPRHRR